MDSLHHRAFFYGFRLEQVGGSVDNLSESKHYPRKEFAMLEVGLDVFLLCAVASASTALCTAVCLWFLMKESSDE